MGRTPVRPHKRFTAAYGKRLEGLSISNIIQQSADRMSDEGATWPWKAKCAGCVLISQPAREMLSPSYRCT
ncbi:MAG: hypothetical protein HFI45_03995 [Lachnospiraceae bacterium]|nr:hypothetical protein [Lachnospiraceae bacterium]